MEPKMRKIFKNSAFQSVFASFICIILGLLFGFIVLLIINPSGAVQGILDILKNFFTFSRTEFRIKQLGNTLAKTAPLIMCSLSVLFCYKVGLFNIGVAGQYAIGAGVSLYAALAWHLPWYVCILLATIGGAISGAIVGVLKSYRNVNEVISGIMLNWISLYTVNMVLTTVKEDTSPYTKNIKGVNPNGLIPSLGLDKVFNTQNMTIALPMAIVVAILVWFILSKTKFGYELKATGYNKNAAKYSGMAEKRNMIVSLAIGGALAAFGASIWFLTGIQQWECSQSSVPSMGFNGIAAAFLGGLNPIGAIFSSYFIQHITEGGAYVDKTMYCAQISDLISSIIIYLCGFVFFLKTYINKKIRKAEDRDAEIARVNDETNPVPVDEPESVIEDDTSVNDEDVADETFDESTEELVELDASDESENASDVEELEKLDGVDSIDENIDDNDTTKEKEEIAE